MVELNWMRGLAALSIMLYHYTSRYDDTIGHVAEWPWMLPYGCGAVNTFFLLTGFLTAYTMHDNMDARTFLWKRAKRLYPTYWACIIVTTLVMWAWFPALQRNLPELLVNLTMFQGFVGVPPVDGVYWTLTFELMFYAFVAIVLMIPGTRSRNLRTFALLWLLVVILLTVYENLAHLRVAIVEKVLMAQFCAPFAGGILACSVWHNPCDRLAWSGIGVSIAASYSIQSLDYFLYFALCLLVLITMGGGESLALLPTRHSEVGTNSFSCFIRSQHFLSSFFGPPVCGMVCYQSYRGLGVE